MGAQPPDAAPAQVGRARDIVFRPGRPWPRTPLGVRHQAGFDEVEAVEEPQDSVPVPGAQGRVRLLVGGEDAPGHGGIGREISAGVAERQIAAGGEAVPDCPDDAVRVVGAGDEVQHGNEQHRDRPPEVQVRADLRHRQQLGRAAHVGLGDDGHAGLGEHGVAVRDHDRVIVDVGDPGRRIGLPGDLVHDVLGGQAHAEVEELVNARLVGQVPHHPGDEFPGSGRGDPHGGQSGQHLLGRVPVGLEGLPAAQVMVVHARHIGRAAIQPFRAFPRGLSLHEENPNREAVAQVVAQRIAPNLLSRPGFDGAGPGRMLHMSSSLLDMCSMLDIVSNISPLPRR